MKRIYYLMSALYALDLQLFAEINKTTDTAATTGNDLSAEMKTFYDMTLIDEAGPALVHDQFGQKRPIPKNEGKVIEFRKFDTLPKALTPLTEGVTPDGKKLNVLSITSELKQYGDFIMQSDVLEMTALDNTVLEATQLLGGQAGRTLDTITRNVLLTGTNVTYCPKLSGATETPVTSRAGLDNTAKLTVDVCMQIATKLKNQNAPTFDGFFIAIIHPSVAYDLMRDPEWKSPHEYSDPENIYKGEIGRIAGIRFVETTEAKIIRGEDLASNSRTLAVNGAITGGSSQHTITFDGGTVESDALKGKRIVMDGKTYTVKTNSATQITTADDEPITSNVANDTVIYPEGNSTGGAVYCTLFIAKGAYGVTELEGGGLETIVKQKGSSGAADPLNQRSTVGWKAMKTAELLIPQYLVRCESCSARFSNSDKEN